MTIAKTADSKRSSRRHLCNIQPIRGEGRVDVLMETLSSTPVLHSFPGNLPQHNKLVKDNTQVGCRSRRTRQSVNVVVAKSIVITVK